MSQGTPPGPKGKGGTVLISQSPYPANPPPGAAPGAPPMAPPAAPPMEPGPGWGAPPGAPGGFGVPGGPGAMAPPGGGFGAPGMGGAPVPAGAGIPDHSPGMKTKLLGLDQNLGSALGYFIGLLSLLFIIMEPKEHRFVRFHAFQWLFVAVAVTINTIVAMVPMIIAMTDRKLTELAYATPILILPTIPLGFLALIAAFKAFQGKAWKIPVIGGIAEKMASGG